MTLRLIREPSRAGATLGVFLVDDCFFSFSLEDPVRERPGMPVESWKVPGETAIPAGRYRVIITPSPRFQRRLPELLDVPGFKSIRIHSGNRSSDTSGCILLGFQRANAVVERSRLAVNELMDQLEVRLAGGEDAFILIENPLSFGG